MYKAKFNSRTKLQKMKEETTYTQKLKKYKPDKERSTKAIWLKIRANY